MDSDFNRYKNFTRVSTDQIRGLKQGQGIFVDLEGKSTIHMFHKRTSSDAMSKTPRVNTERRTARKSVPTPETQVLDDFDEDLYADIYDETEQDPLPMRPPVKPAMPEKGPQADDIDLDLAVVVWNAGQNSVGKLMRMFRLTNHQAQKLRKLILARADAQSEEEAD
jgi:hypothetical protein